MMRGLVFRQGKYPYLSTFPLSKLFFSSFKDFSLFRIKTLFSSRAIFPTINSIRISFVRLYATENSSFIIDQSKLRNIAIIAHVDHGKTSIVDCLLQQSGVLASTSSTSNETGNSLEDNVRVMDSNILEKERGITILSKCTSVQYGEYRINIVDTPGHADFGGEVERVLGMVDGVALIVDATEGPMAQTKFVLTKALRQGLLPIVVVNKVDRDTSRTDQVDSDILDLFCMLDANEKQMSYPVLFASAKEGWATKINPSLILKEASTDQVNATLLKEKIFNGQKPSMDILFKTIIDHVPPPKGDRSKPFSMLVNNIESGSYVGKCFFGKVETGCIRLNDRVKCLTPNISGTSKLSSEEGRIVKLFVRRGLQQVPIEEAAAGDIISFAGLSSPSVNSTICSPEVNEMLPWVPVDPPTLSIIFSPNTSPLSGLEGRAATTQQLVDRLKKESETNVALKVVYLPKSSSESIEVFGRGELHLAILIETMRREGVEFSISPPKVLLQPDPDSINGKLEPIEELTIDLDEEYSGTVIDKLTRRKGELVRVAESHGKSRLIFKIPTRGLLGYHSEFKNDTHGTGVLNHSFSGFEKFKGRIDVSRKGALISMSEGTTTAFALGELEDRGVLFIGPGKSVYPGMVIGECSRSFDMDVNPVKTKAVSNYRAVCKDDAIRLAAPRGMTLEDFIAYIADDEMIEITPKSIRLRKKYLDANERKRYARISSQDEGRMAI